MPWNNEHKTKSRDKILEAAACLFTQKGYDAVSIDDVMRNAGLTRGAFYAHFSSKADLYNQAVLSGARLAGTKVRGGATGFESLVRRYLSIGLDSIDEDIFNEDSECSKTETSNQDASEKASSDEETADYCPLAFLVTDICHRDQQIKQTYTKTLQGYQGLLREFDLDEAQAIQISILMIGGLALSRAVSDENVRNKLLRNSYLAVMSMLKSEPLN